MHLFKIFKYLLFSRANKSALLSFVLKATYFLLDVPSVIKWSAVLNNTWVVSSFYFYSTVTDNSGKSILETTDLLISPVIVLKVHS